MDPTDRNLDQLSVNAIRFLAADAVENAGSGHPGMPMGMAPVGMILWREFLRHDPSDPRWPDRDRFVLSAGHGAMLLYALLHLTGHDFPLEELRRLRQWGSKTPGHPERHLVPEIEVTTGPLGQGISNAVGLALAERKLAAEFNREGWMPVDHRTWVIASDGDMMEGISHESCSLAGHWGLGKLKVIYDDNHISIDGPTRLAFDEDVTRRFDAYGWHTQRIADANDLDALRAAFRQAEEETARPSLIAVRSHIGYGSPKQDSAGAHGEALGAEAIAAARRTLGWSYPPFVIPPEVYRHMDVRDRGRRLQEEWRIRWSGYAAEHPDLAREFERRMRGLELPEEWDRDLPDFAGAKPQATRTSSQTVLSALSPRIPELIGGSADLTPSNRTRAADQTEFSLENPTGRYLHYGVREHGMAAIMNGIAAHGGYRPYGGTFLIFSDYHRPAVRLAALSKLPVIFVYTHDSIGLGGDGPTHQPVGELMGLRAMPGLWVIRPADAAETSVAWKLALERIGGPTALVLSRQDLPVIDRQADAPVAGMLRGGYVLREVERPQAAIVATGSEVQLALRAEERLRLEGLRVRVVSLPCFELFESQEDSYRRSVLPADLPTLAIEAGATLGWERYADRVLGLDHFGASAPGEVIFEKFGFTVDNVILKVKALIAHRDSPRTGV